jgi:uncharacterized protein
MIDPELLAILACPQCKGPLRLTEDQAAPGLACDSCRLWYEIRDGIPVMLVEKAQPLD